MMASFTNRLLPLLLLGFLQNTRAASNWDWEFTHWSVFDENAQYYVTEKSTVAKITLGELTFWAPQQGTTAGQLTQRFVFTNSIVDARLQIPVIQVGHTANNNSGSISVWASKNGTDWERLLDAPPPPLPEMNQLVAISHTYSYNQSLPQTLLGSSELWLQVRMASTGDPMLSRFLQYRSGSDDNLPFTLSIRFAPKPPDIDTDQTTGAATPRRASAVVDVVFGSVAGITLQDGGQGYSQPPVILLPSTAPDGIPAVIKSEIENGRITRLRIVEAGSGYRSGLPLFISAPPFCPITVQTGKRYQLHHSPDLLHWTPAGEPFTATQPSIVQEFEVDSAGLIYQLRPVD
jgi:hypothetical protein